MTLSAGEHRCVACAAKDAEITRLRAAYQLMEQALFTFMGTRK